jgi:hypothetical protein
MIVAETIKRINSADPQKIAEALKDTKFEGTTGVITFERKEGPVWNQWMGHQLFVKKLTKYKQKGEDAECLSCEPSGLAEVENNFVIPARTGYGNPVVSALKYFLDPGGPVGEAENRGDDFIQLDQPWASQVSQRGS